MQKMSLVAVAREQMARAREAGAGRSSETVYGGHEHSLRQTVITLLAGQHLTEHENPGEATVHVLNGRLELRSGDTIWEGRSGDLLIVPQARHAVTALEDVAFLLTVAK